jgi:hypothetical protein
VCVEVLFFLFYFFRAGDSSLGMAGGWFVVGSGKRSSAHEVLHKATAGSSTGGVEERTL